MLAPDHPLAYWGVAYFNYIAGGTRDIFRCPSAKVVDEWRENGLTYPNEFWLYSSYGINNFVVRPFPDTPLPNGTRRPPRPLQSFLNPATTIAVQDSAEQKMECDTDSWGLFPGFSENLTQWKYDLAGLYPRIKMEMEWFRHNRRGEAVWLDGHVSALRFTLGCDYRWYTGEAPGGVGPQPEP